MNSWKTAPCCCASPPPPEKGKANRACVDLLANALGVPRGAIALVRGERSRDKVFSVAGLSEAEIAERLRQACGQTSEA